MIFDRYRYVCAQFFLVEVSYVYTPTSVPPIVTATMGINEGEQITRTYKVSWHREEFSRDDINDDDVQRGYRSHRVQSAVRRIWKARDIELATMHGRLRVVADQGYPDPFVVGFTWSWGHAVRWSATGRGALSVPWSAEEYRP